MSGDTLGKVLGTIAGFAGLGFVGAALATRKSSSSSNPTMRASDLQREMLEALRTPAGGIDPYDFVGLVRAYCDETGADRPFDAREWLSDQINRKRFVEWLDRTSSVSRWIADAPTKVPPHYYFRDAAALPAGTWLTHWSAHPIRKFDRGATFRNIGVTSLTKSVKSKRHNLGDEVGQSDRVYSFAYTLDHNPCIRSGRYSCSGKELAHGSHMVIFQSDAAIEAFQENDGEWQAMFPSGSEYNLHEVYGEDDGSWQIRNPRTGDYSRVSTIRDVADVLERAT